MTASHAQDLELVLESIAGLERQLFELRRRIYHDIRGAELPEGRHDLLTCRVGEDAVALPLARVEAVVPFCALTPIPEAPSWVVGLFDFHGESMPALDLEARLSGRQHEPSPTDVMIVCRDDERRAALVVQDLGGVHRDVSVGARDEVHDVPHASYVLGAVRLGDRPVIVLSVPRLLAALPVAEEPES